MPAKTTPKQNRSLILLHGYAGGAEKNWLPWLHRQAEDVGIRVWAPELPDALKPELKKWLKVTSDKAAEWGSDTIVVGHSLGGVLALRLLETVCQKPVRGVILVGSPFAATLNFQWFTGFFDQPIDWAKIRRRAGKRLVIQSKNDPVVPFDHAFRYQEALAAGVTVTEKGGHFTGRKEALIWDAVREISAPGR